MRSLMTTAMKFKHDFQELKVRLCPRNSPCPRTRLCYFCINFASLGIRLCPQTVFNREIKSLQVEKKKVSDNAARLQACPLLGVPAGSIRAPGVLAGWVPLLARHSDVFVVHRRSRTLSSEIRLRA